MGVVSLSTTALNASTNTSTLSRMLPEKNMEESKEEYEECKTSKWEYFRDLEDETEEDKAQLRALSDAQMIMGYGLNPQRLQQNSTNKELPKLNLRIQK